jgi:hypothetical protein
MVKMVKGVIKKKIQDWRVADGVEIENPADLKEYDLNVDVAGGQLYIDVADEKAEGLMLLVEIHQGKPCIHIGTEIGGDMLIHVFSVDKGLIITRESDDVTMSEPKPSRYTYNSNGSIEFR